MKKLRVVLLINLCKTISIATYLDTRVPFKICIFRGLKQISLLNQLYASLCTLRITMYKLNYEFSLWYKENPFAIISSSIPREITLLDSLNSILYLSLMFSICNTSNQYSLLLQSFS